jgi:hypothetical protein
MSDSAAAEPESLSDDERLERIRTHQGLVWLSDGSFLLRLVDRLAAESAAVLAAMRKYDEHRSGAILFEDLALALHLTDEDLDALTEPTCGECGNLPHLVECDHFGEETDRCICGTPGLNYEGPQEDCPLHGGPGPALKSVEGVR